MDDFTFHNSSLPVFLKELARRFFAGLFNGVVLFVRGFIYSIWYLWKPVCDTCKDRKPECLTLEEPCLRQFEQRILRTGLFLASIASLVVLAVHIYKCK